MCLNYIKQCQGLAQKGSQVESQWPMEQEIQGCSIEWCSWGMCEQGLEAGKFWVKPPIGLLLLVVQCLSYTMYWFHRDSCKPSHISSAVWKSLIQYDPSRYCPLPTSKFHLLLETQHSRSHGEGGFLWFLCMKEARPLKINSIFIST